MTSLTEISVPHRVADKDEAVGLDELGLAARNHGMPLELMRHDVTPLGAHYLLTHFDIPGGDADTWRLEVGGLVGRPASLTIAQLRERPAVTRTVTMECAGNGRAWLAPRPVSQPWLNEAVGTMTWTGTSLRGVLAEATPLDGAVDVVFTGADHGVERGIEQDYARSLTLDQAMDDDVLLVWGCNGVDLPPQHGYPLRLLVPGWYGMASVKWLRSIEVVDHGFEGFQMAAYRLRDEAEDPGLPLTRINPRALVLPPGFPDYLSRRRVLREGRHELTGRAWSGWGEIVSVQVSVDDGGTWTEAELGPQPDPRAWRGWRLPWAATRGDHTVSARATDTTGRTQPADPSWNRGGFANNSLQRVPVTVLGADEAGSP